jgi:hypothetical protein
MVRSNTHISFHSKTNKMKKHNYFRFLLATAVLPALMPAAATAQWTYVGRPGFSPSGAPHVQHTEMVINDQNEIYVGFADYGYPMVVTPGGNQFAPSGTVMKYTDTGWQAVGQPGFTPGATNHCSLTLGKGDTVYYAFADGTATGFSRGRVMRFDGQTWDFMGDVLTVSEAKFTNVQVSSDGTVYFSAVDRGPGGFVDGALIVKRYTGTSWVNVGATHPASGAAKVPVGYFAIDRQDSLWIVYADNSNGTKLAVKKFDGTDWVQVGPSFLAGTTPNPGYQPNFIGACDPCGIHLAFDHNNTPYVSYSAINMNAPNLTVHKFDGSDWAIVGPAYFTKDLHGFGPTVTRGRLAFDNADTPYIAFWDQATVNGERGLPHVMKFNGTGWQHVGAPGFVNKMTAWHALVVDGNNNPYVAFFDSTVGGRISVMKYTVCEAPTAVAVAASATDVCVGDTVMLTVSGTLNDATGWEWYEGSCGGTLIGTGDTVYVTPTDTTTYYVRGMGACVVSGGCKAVTVNATYVPKPTIGADGDTLVSSAPAGNQWYLDGTPIPGATGVKHGATTTGVYAVTVTVGPCSNSSDTLYLEPIGISQIGAGDDIRVYPVPFTHSVNVRIGSSMLHTGGWSLSVADNLGRVVYSQHALSRQNTIDLSHLTRGVYFIRIHTDNDSRVFKVVKE